MFIIRWAIWIVFGLGLLSISVLNRHNLTVILLPGVKYELPVYIFGLGFLALGLIWGGVVGRLKYGLLSRKNKSSSKKEKFVKEHQDKTKKAERKLLQFSD